MLTFFLTFEYAIAAFALSISSRISFRHLFHFINLLGDLILNRHGTYRHIYHDANDLRKNQGVVGEYDPLTNKIRYITYFET